MSTSPTVNEAVINQLADEIHATAVDKGFWEAPDPYIAETCVKLALITTEVAEATDVIRACYDGAVNPYTRMTAEQTLDFIEELYDVIIRTFDLIANFDRQSAEIMLAKMTKNSGRPKKHGKRF